MQALIGGEFEIDPGYWPNEGLALETNLELPEGRFALFGTAREAVRWWVDHLAPPGPILVPAYCCRSVVQPFLEAGVPLRYYPVENDLSVDPARVRPLVAGAAAIQVIHYFGVPANKALFNLGIPVLEDAVQGLLSPDLRTNGDWAIGSLRKYFPVPDGALLVAKSPFIPPHLQQAEGGPYGRKRFGRMLKHHGLTLGNAFIWAEALAILHETEEALDSATLIPHVMSDWSREALRGIDLGLFAAIRRANYEALLAALEGIPGIRPLLGPLAPGVVPYGLPILCEGRDELKAALLERGIYSVVHWDLPSDIDPEEFPDSFWLYKRLLTLPIDQRYGIAEMTRIGNEIARIKSGS